MTGQPPDDTERIYKQQYEDPLPQTTQYAYGDYGEPRYRETPQQEEDQPQYQEPQQYPATPQFTPADPQARARYRDGEPDAGSYGAGGSEQTPPPPVPPAPPGPAGRPRPGGGGSRGFIGSLFDFSFSSFVTPRIIKALYALFVVAAAVTSLIFIVFAFRVSTGFGIFTLLVLAPIGFLLWVAFYRVILEFYMVTFRMAEDIRDLRDRDRESR
jgi:hypothetical protein